MRFFRDGCVSAVLESSYTHGILRFSVRRFLALTQKTLFSRCPLVALAIACFARYLLQKFGLVDDMPAMLTA